MICPVCLLPYDQERIKTNFVGRKTMCYVCFKEAPKIIALDFDGTIADYDGWKGVHHKGLLLEGGRKFLEELRALGFVLVIVTARPTDGIQEWLEENKIDHLIESITNLKIAAYCYIDDRALSFNNNFNETLEQVKTFSPWYLNK